MWSNSLNVFFIELLFHFYGDLISFLSNTPMSHNRISCGEPCNAIKIILKIILLLPQKCDVRYHFIL